MFTGIVEATAQLLEKTDRTLTVERPATFIDMKEGGSVSVSGVCLTVTALDSRSMRFDVVPETWAKTKLGSLQIGEHVNLERAMRADSRLDGHIVQGHVEGVGRVVASIPRPLPPEEETPQGWRGEGEFPQGESLLTVEIPPELMPCIVPKGSIALDGVSLTVAALEGSHVTVALIPTTLLMTTLGGRTEGDPVNIETDVLLRRK